mgnify:CR=1 FL=1
MKINTRNNTTWTPAWNHGKTQVIRVPAVLVPGILEYARWLDEHSKYSFAQSALGDFSCNLILQAIDEYIEWRRDRQHPNQYSTKLNTNARTWDELRKFRAMVESGDMTSFKISD